MSDNTMNIGRRGFLGTGLLAAVAQGQPARTRHAV